MPTLNRLLVISLFSQLIAGSAAWSASSYPSDPSQEQPQEPSQEPSLEYNQAFKVSEKLKASEAHYEGECKKFINQKLYEPALFSCYSAFQLGSSDMGAVLYQLGANHFFDEITSNNLMQEYQSYQGSPEIQRLLMSIKFTSQSDGIVQGSIYGSWCFDKEMNQEAAGGDDENGSFEDPSYEGYSRLVINPAGQYIKATAKIEQGSFTYNQNRLSLGYPSFSEYQVKILDKNQMILKTQGLKDKIYSRKACSKLGMQRFIQALVNNKSTTSCDDISNYLGRHLIPAQYLPTAILNKLKQDPKRYDCPQLIQKISEA